MVKVSIIMPVWNAEASLWQAWESLRVQTLSDWELVVGDDGSTDGTASLLARMAAEDARVRVVVQPHRGIAAALQVGCVAARGQYLARMDADDVCAPERLERQVAVLDARADIGLVSCCTQFGGDTEHQAGYAAHVDWLNGLLTPEAIAANRFVDSPVAHPSVMFRRSVMARFGGYRDDAFAEDYELWLRWLGQGVRFVKLPEKLVTWYDSPQRLSRMDLRYSVEAMYALKMPYLAKCIPPERPVWLWGAGRITRKRFAPLETLCRPFAGFVDIDPAKTGRTLHGRPVVLPAALPADAWVVVGVGSRGARDKISADLLASGRFALRDYVLAA
ncbi:MAG: glycosyltransferase family 2 protein [Kiritimatiellia bacterium]